MIMVAELSDTCCLGVKEHDLGVSRRLFLSKTLNEPANCSVYGVRVNSNEKSKKISKITKN